MLTKEIILEGADELRKIHPYFRRGQAVFNWVDSVLGVARVVQFVHHIDCFYNDNEIDKFIDKSLECYESLYPQSRDTDSSQ